MLIVLALLVTTSPGCVKRRDTQRAGEMRGRSVEQVFDSHRDTLLSIPGVVGAGIARLDDRPVIVVMVKERTPELEARIPREFDGYSVVIEIADDFKTLDGK
jgi:dTDP-4-dehydrorhamnose 3,5-epimerase-like enzyme